MSGEANKAVFRAVVESLAKGRKEVCDAHPGLALMQPGFADLFIATPDSAIGIYELIADGDWVAARLMRRITHAGVWNEDPPLDLQVNREAIVICRFSGGRIVEIHSQSNLAGQWMHRRTDEGTDE